jgi:hypothetical protein
LQPNSRSICSSHACVGNSSLEIKMVINKISSPKTTKIKKEEKGR